MALLRAILGLQSFPHGVVKDEDATAAVSSHDQGSVLLGLCMVRWHSFCRRSDSPGINWCYGPLSSSSSFSFLLMPSLGYHGLGLGGLWPESEWEGNVSD
jgi:hypothetical protein